MYMLLQIPSQLLPTEITDSPFSRHLNYIPYRDRHLSPKLSASTSVCSLRSPPKIRNFKGCGSARNNQSNLGDFAEEKQVHSPIGELDFLVKEQEQKGFTNFVIAFQDRNNNGNKSQRETKDMSRDLGTGEKEEEKVEDGEWPDIQDLPQESPTFRKDSQQNKMGFVWKKSQENLNENYDYSNEDKIQSIKMEIEEKSLNSPRTQHSKNQKNQVKTPTFSSPNFKKFSHKFSNPVCSSNFKKAHQFSIPSTPVSTSVNTETKISESIQKVKLQNVKDEKYQQVIKNLKIKNKNCHNADCRLPFTSPSKEGCKFLNRFKKKQ